MKSTIGDMVLCSLIEICRRFGETHCLHLQGLGVSQQEVCKRVSYLLDDFDPFLYHIMYSRGRSTFLLKALLLDKCAPSLRVFLCVRTTDQKCLSLSKLTKKVTLPVCVRFESRPEH
jgi:hypothetical protein